MLAPSPSPPVASSPPPTVASPPQEAPDHAVDTEEVIKPPNSTLYNSTLYNSTLYNSARSEQREKVKKKTEYKQSNSQAGRVPSTAAVLPY